MPSTLLRVGILLAVLTVLLLLQKPHSTSLQIKGSSTLVVPADRATISLRVSSEGSKQSKVANEVRQTTDEVLALLRPLTQPRNGTVVTGSSSSSSSRTDEPPPIATLAVNTFSSDSYPRASILGETTTYSAAVTITAEFRALPNSTQSADRTVMPGSEFRYLSLVLPSLAKTPRARVQYLKWFLSPGALAERQSEARQKATADALAKIADYMAPLHLRLPSVRCRTFAEEQIHRPHGQHQGGRGGYRGLYRARLASRAPEWDAAHDELSEPEEFRYDIEQTVTEAFGLEPQSMEIGSRVEGDWVVVERDLLGLLRGMVL